MVRGLAMFSVVVAVALTAVLLPAQDNKPQDKPKETTQASDVTPQMQNTIEKGLAWLSKNQNRNGSYPSSAPVATTALSGVAFLAGGHIPGRSKYGENVRKCIEFLIRCTGRTGYINEGQMRGAGGSGMHGHGYALLFLSEAYGMTDALETDLNTPKLKEIITRAVRVTEQAQAPNGGWNYEPNQSWDEGSVTVTQVQALRAARNAGITVNLKTIEKAVDYINKSTNDNGQTSYSLSSGRGDTRPTLTAAGMSVLCYLGQYDNPKIEKGLTYLLKHFKPGQGANDSSAQAWGTWWFFYGNYYATASMYQAGGKYWTEWWPAVRDTIIKAQDSRSGAWRNGESGQYGAAFGSALALITLQIPYRYLPIFQRAND